MRFTWTGLLLAPLLAPLLMVAVILSLLDVGAPRLLFVFVMVVGCVISYGTTIVLFLPSLFLLSLWRRVTALSVCLLGLALGAAICVPLTWVAWASSGPDSGPPTESFFTFFPRWITDPSNAICPLAGLLTAGAYWALGTWRLRHAHLAPPSIG